MRRGGKGDGIFIIHGNGGGRMGGTRCVHAGAVEHRTRCWLGGAAPNNITSLNWWRYQTKIGNRLFRVIGLQYQKTFKLCIFKTGTIARYNHVDLILLAINHRPQGGFLWYQPDKQARADRTFAYYGNSKVSRVCWSSWLSKKEMVLLYSLGCSHWPIDLMNCAHVFIHCARKIR